MARTILKELNHPDKEISILFVDDRQIRDLNNKFLKRNFPTNVISFPMAQGEFSEITPHLLGDVVISVETAMKEAQESGLSLEQEIVFLLIHGILHLTGYDHTRESRKQMEKVQEGLFKKLRLIRGRKPKDAPSKP
ncbi:MAG: rRNA maturation RNase YbeY [Thermodesulfobacteriota bacterium]